MLFCWTVIPAILGLVEGIIYAISTEEEFDIKYNYQNIQNNQSTSNHIPQDILNSKIIYNTSVKFANAKLREEPNARSTIRNHLSEHTKVDVIQEEREWVKVLVQDNSNYGWILRALLDNTTEKDKSIT